MKKKNGKPAKTHKSDVLNDFFSSSTKEEYEKAEKNMLLASRIEKAMQRKELNKGEFALEMKVQPSVVTKWLSGTHNFTVDTLYDIERCLSISLVNVNEPANIQTIQTFRFVLTDKISSHTFSLPCALHEDLVKVKDVNMGYITN